MDSSEVERLVRLEAEVAAMREEIAVLRGALRYRERGEALGAPRNNGTIGNPQVPPGDRHPRPEERRGVSRPTISVEQAVGRYGALAIGTICVLLGFGTFITWAIARGLLGPNVRVALGAAGAVGLAGGGAWLRIKGTREFGNILLAIALAAAHVVCWGAGPHLQIVPPVVALAIALGASALLAEFALRHDEEALCAVGFGGAAIAPFVASSGGSPLTAPIYGLIVIALATAALRGRPWRVATRVVAGSVALFEGASLAGVQIGRATDHALIDRAAPLLFPLATLVAFVVVAHPRNRRYFIRCAAIAAIVAGAVRAMADGGTTWALAITVITAVATAIALEISRATPLEREEARAGVSPAVAVDPTVEWAADGALIPLAFFGAALLETPGFGSRASVMLAAGWTIAALVATYVTRTEGETDWYAVTASLAALTLPVAASLYDAHQPLFAVVLAAVVLGVIHRGMPRRAFAACARGALAVAAAVAIVDLHNRAPFAYEPFATVSTLEAAAVVAGWVLLLFLEPASGESPSVSPSTIRAAGLPWRTIAQFGCAVTAFLWVREELAGAWGATAATVLLVAYYGIMGAIAIRVGQRLAERAVRLVGLGLTMLAAGKTLVQAFNVPNVAVRVGLLFLVSGFLIGVAYWYRKGAGELHEPSVVTEST